MRGILAVLTTFIACTAPATPPASATLAQAIPSTSAPTTPTATATAGAAPRLITHDNASLGYRLALPEIYRRVSADLFIGQPELIGRDTYTNLTEEKEPDRTVRIDLFLDVRDARWQWVSALHHYSRADLGLQICIPYRSPWVSANRC